jgi:hypothetical protein
VLTTTSGYRYKKYREEQEKLHLEWVKRNDLRNAAIARGEKVGRAERDPTEQVEIGLWGLVKFLLITFAIITLTGKYITGDYFWEADLAKWGQLSTYIPAQQRLFSERVLAKYDGSDPEDPIYLAVGPLRFVRFYFTMLTVRFSWTGTCMMCRAIGAFTDPVDLIVCCKFPAVPCVLGS